MSNKIVDIKGRPRANQKSPVPDFWFAQIDLRLGRIESMVTRLEWQVWVIVCGAFGLLVLEIVQAIAAD